MGCGGRGSVGRVRGCRAGFPLSEACERSNGALTNDAEADGKAVWSCRLAIFCAWGKLKKPRPIKGFYGLAARARRAAERRRALLGPSFTSCPFGRELGLRPEGFIRSGCAPVARGRLSAGRIGDGLKPLYGRLMALAMWPG